MVQVCSSVVVALGYGSQWSDSKTFSVAHIQLKPTALRAEALYDLNEGKFCLDEGQ